MPQLVLKLDVRQAAARQALRRGHRRRHVHARVRARHAAGASAVSRRVRTAAPASPVVHPHPRGVEWVVRDVNRWRSRRKMPCRAPGHAGKGSVRARAAAAAATAGKGRPHRRGGRVRRGRAADPSARLPPTAGLRAAAAAVATAVAVGWAATAPARVPRQRPVQAQAQHPLGHEGAARVLPLLLLLRTRVRGNVWFLSRPAPDARGSAAAPRHAL